MGCSACAVNQTERGSKRTGSSPISVAVGTRRELTVASTQCALCLLLRCCEQLPVSSATVKSKSRRGVTTGLFMLFDVYGERVPSFTTLSVGSLVPMVSTSLEFTRLSTFFNRCTKVIGSIVHARSGEPGDEAKCREKQLGMVGIDSVCIPATCDAVSSCQ